MNLPSQSLLSLLAGTALLSSGLAQSSHYDRAVPEESRVRQDSSPATPPPPAESITQAPSPKVPAQSDRFTTDSTRFKALDTDSDGRISRAEFTLAPNQEPIDEAAEAAAPRSATVKKPWWSRKSAGQNAAGANDSNIGTPTDTAEVFEKLDADKDGFLNRAELAVEPDRKADK